MHSGTAAMSDLHLDPRSTALVVIDLQRGVATTHTEPYDASAVVARAAQLTAAFREHGSTVVLVNVDPGPNGERMPHPIADQPRQTRQYPADFPELMPELGTASSDVLVTKYQPNAFYQTDLDHILHERGVQTIVLCGISTNVGVEATARAAYERRYEQLFAEDAMASRNAETHRVSTTLFFPTIGRVRRTDDIIAALA
jgi:nicotinamidase-related amidase